MTRIIATDLDRLELQSATPGPAAGSRAESMARLSANLDELAAEMAADDDECPASAAEIAWATDRLDRAEADAVLARSEARGLSWTKRSRPGVSPSISGTFTF